MKKEQLKYIKNRLKQFYLLVDPICTYWGNNQKHLLTLSVLLQNIQFNGSECESHEKTVQELRLLQGFVNNIANYYNSHLENWIKDEINSIIDFESVHFDE